MKTKIIETINQAIIFIDNQKPHLIYGTVDSHFNNSFNINTDYKKLYASWFSKTSFHNASTEPAKILNGENDIQPSIEDNKLIFKNITFDIDTTWGYGKYFDGESVELTSKSKEFIDTIALELSHILNCKVSIIDYVDCDYEADMNFKIIVELKKESKTKISLEEQLEKYLNEMITFNNNIKNRIINQKSKKKTCSNCDSNVSTSYFKSHKCPVCNNAMYTDTDKKRFNNLSLKIKNTKEKINKKK